MAISAQDVQRAYASPIDYGSLVTQSLEQQRRHDLEQAQLAQQQEDRDIRQAQLINESLAPLSKDTGTYYDTIMHDQLADIISNRYPKYVKNNPNAKLGQQLMYMNQEVANVANKAQQAKQIQAFSRDMAKVKAKDVAGLDEASLAREFEKSAYKDGDIVNNWQDILAKNAEDMDFVGNHYSLSGASLEKLGKLINAKQGYEKGRIIDAGGRKYQITNPFPLGFDYDPKTKLAKPITEQEDVLVTRMNGLTPIQTTQKVDLVPQSTIDEHIFNPEFQHALNKIATDLNANDPLTKNMTDNQRIRYAATELLKKLRVDGMVDDRTDEIARQEKADIRAEKAEKRAQSNFENGGRNFNLQADRVADMFDGSNEWASTFPKETIYSTTYDDKGSHTIKYDNAYLLTKDFPDYKIHFANKESKVYRRGDKFFVQDYNGDTPEGELREISPIEAEDYKEAIRTRLGNKLGIKTDKPITTTTKVVTSQPKKEENSAIEKLKQNSKSGEEVNYGLRHDNKTYKGTGYLGVLKTKSGKNVTEYSIGTDIDGKEMDIPSVVPTLTKQEIQYILDKADKNEGIGKDAVGNSIFKKAVEHARKRISEGKSVWANSGVNPKAEKPANKTEKPKKFNISY